LFPQHFSIHQSSSAYFVALYFVGPPTDIQLTISNLATTSQLILLTRTLTPNHNLTVY